MSHETEAALRGCALRDESALHALVTMEAGRFAGVATRMLRHPELVAQAVPAAFLRIWREVAETPYQTLDWAFSCLRAECRAVLRDADALAGLDADALGVMQQNRQYLAPGEAWRFLPQGALRDALADMDQPLRQSVLLVHAAGFSLDEVAALQKVPPGIAQAWIADALSRLGDGEAQAFADGRHTPVDAVLLPLDLCAGEVACDPWADIAPHLAPVTTPQVPEDAAPVASPRRKWPVLPVAAAIGGLAIGVLAAFALPTRAPAALAVLLTPQGTPAAVVEDYANGSVKLHMVGDIPVADGQVPQLWTRPSLEMGTVSLGVGAGVLDGADLPAPQSGQTYQITAEPEGGSPTGRPTGPVIATGTAIRP